MANGGRRVPHGEEGSYVLTGENVPATTPVGEPAGTTPPQPSARTDEYDFRRFRKEVLARAKPGRTRTPAMGAREAQRPVAAPETAEQREIRSLKAAVQGQSLRIDALEQDLARSQQLLLRAQQDVAEVGSGAKAMIRNKAEEARLIGDELTAKSIELEATRTEVERQKQEVVGLKKQLAKAKMDVKNADIAARQNAEIREEEVGDLYKEIDTMTVLIETLKRRIAELEGRGGARR